MKQAVSDENNFLKILFFLLALAIVFLLAPINYGQDKRPTIKQYQTPAQQPADQPATNTTLVISPDEDYLIGPSDVIEVKIEDAPELSGIYRLNANGTFILPVAGRIAAEKKRTEEVAAAITDKLRGSYLINPLVTVLVKQSNSRAFFIQGAVRRPGIYQIEGHPSLLKLITIAGGLADNYGSTAYVMREKPTSKDVSTEGLITVKASNTPSVSPDAATAASPNTDEIQDSGAKHVAVQHKNENDNQSLSTELPPTAAKQKTNTFGEDDKYELFQANINNLLRGNLDQNLIIEPGDIVHIPQTDVFFVAGEVKAPGSFPLKEGTTLRQAISLAQGTTFEGATDKGVIFREDRTGKRQEIPVNVGAVMAGKKDDIDILPNDIIIVPNSTKKTVAKSLMQSFSGTVPALLLHSFGVW